MAKQPAACKDGGSRGSSFLISWCRHLPETENRIAKQIFFPHLNIFKVEKLPIVFVDGWHTGEYNLVINNYTLPKDISEKTDEKIQTGPEQTRTPKSAHNSAAILVSPWLLQKQQRPS